MILLIVVAPMPEFRRRMEMVLKILAFGPGFRPPEDPTADPELAVLATITICQLNWLAERGSCWWWISGMRR
jgi:hypothetical protein